MFGDMGDGVFSYPAGEGSVDDQLIGKVPVNGGTCFKIIQQVSGHMSANLLGASPSPACLAGAQQAAGIRFCPKG
jgi:hypothetical protein